MSAVSEFNAQELANTAWAFAVVNIHSSLLFGPAFTQRLETMVWTDSTDLSQLHQWALWHQELQRIPPLSPTLSERCIFTDDKRGGPPGGGARDMQAAAGG